MTRGTERTTVPAVGHSQNHIPHTVIGGSPGFEARRKIRSRQLFPGRMSKSTKCPDSAPQESMYNAVCSLPLRITPSKPDR